jgi:arylsulfatase A-like enzyme
VPQKYYDQFPLASVQLPKILETDLDDVPTPGVKLAGADGDHRRIIESGRWKDAVQGYLAAHAYADAMIGRLMEAFDRSAYKDNTIIVFWGDHGWSLGEKMSWRKNTLWEEATRAPLVFVVPGLTKPGSVSMRTVDFMSIYPTLDELCGLPQPAHLEGVSIRPLLENPAAAWDRPALTTRGSGNHAVRSEAWRYIRYADGSEELYDETADPLEWKNLAGDAQYSSIKADLARWMPMTDAPDPETKADVSKKKAKKHAKKKSDQ